MLLAACHAPLTSVRECVRCVGVLASERRRGCASKPQRRDPGKASFGELAIMMISQIGSSSPPRTPWQVEPPAGLPVTEGEEANLEAAAVVRETAPLLCPIGRELTGTYGH